MNAAAIEHIRKCRDILEADVEIALAKFTDSTGLEATDLDIDTAREHNVEARKQRIVKYIVHARAQL